MLRKLKYCFIFIENLHGLEKIIHRINGKFTYNLYDTIFETTNWFQIKYTNGLAILQSFKNLYDHYDEHFQTLLKANKI